MYLDMIGALPRTLICYSSFCMILLTGISDHLRHTRPQRKSKQLQVLKSQPYRTHSPICFHFYLHSIAKQGANHLISLKLTIRILSCKALKLKVCTQSSNALKSSKCTCSFTLYVIIKKKAIKLIEIYAM